MPGISTFKKGQELQGGTFRELSLPRLRDKISSTDEACEAEYNRDNLISLSNVNCSDRAHRGSPGTLILYLIAVPTRETKSTDGSQKEEQSNQFVNTTRHQLQIGFFSFRAMTPRWSAVKTCQFI